jgi:hypothetical protein
MSTTYVSSFNTIRLNNNIVAASGGILTVGANTAIYQSQTGGFVDISKTGNFITNGQTGGFINSAETGLLSNAFYPLNSNPAGYITSAQAGGVSSLSVTGYNISGTIIISGISGISVTTGGSNEILIGIVNSGQFAPAGLTGNFITNGMTGVLTNQFWSTSNNQEFSTLIPSGADFTGILFPITFSSIPRVLVTVEITGIYIYNCNIGNRTTSGYNAYFSDIIQENGVTLHTFASIQ